MDKKVKRKIDKGSTKGGDIKLPEIVIPKRVLALEEPIKKVLVTLASFDRDLRDHMDSLEETKKNLNKLKVSIRKRFSK